MKIKNVTFRERIMEHKGNVITDSKVKIRDKSLSDAAEDYLWQTDCELAYLDAAPVLVTTFCQYLSDYIDELRYSNSTGHRFAVETLDGQHIGNCGYYGVDKAKGEAELGILIGNRDYWNKGYGADIVSILVSHIFHKTNLKRIYLKTLDSNIRAQKCFKKCGFATYGHLARDGYRFTLMETYRMQWKE
jgi:RimJ/RimL family protein N-acetyltransferase